MNTEELLKPRYKVIAEMPVLPFKLNEVFNADFVPITALGKDVYVRLDIYPHLFKRLKWYEERKPEEMPEYLRVKDERELIPLGVFKVEYYSGTDHARLSNNQPAYLGWTLPATKEEYESFIEKSKPKIID